MGTRDLTDLIRRSFSDLDRLGARLALVGGFAVSVRARPRTTKDVDFTVAVADDREAEALIRQLIRGGYRAAAILEHEDRGRLATVRLYVPESASTEPDVDLLFASCGIENEVVTAATNVSLAGVGWLPTARTGHLIAMKVLAESDVREHDRQDLNALIAVADQEEIALAEGSLRLIEDRGYARGKRLLNVLESFVRRREAR